MISDTERALIQGVVRKAAFSATARQLLAEAGLPADTDASVCDFCGGRGVDPDDHPHPFGERLGFSPCRQCEGYGVTFSRGVPPGLCADCGDVPVTGGAERCGVCEGERQYDRARFARYAARNAARSADRALDAADDARAAALWEDDDDEVPEFYYD